MDSHLKIKSMPPLCFNKDDFVGNEFSVDRFVSECRKYASLETMREDLGIYHKILCTAMVELINKDYADFVNLSSNLVGFDKSIKSLTTPLQSLKAEIDEIKQSLDETLLSANTKFEERATNRDTKVLIHHILGVLEGLEKISSLNALPEISNDSLQLETLERIAFTFNMVQFHMKRISDVKELANRKEDVNRVAIMLEEKLECVFLQSLSDQNTQNLQKILRIYSVINEERKVEDCFRRSVVRPYMKKLITQGNITKCGLAKIFTDILAFIPAYTSNILAVTRGTNGQTEIVPGYDFIVNALWPEVMDCFEYIAPMHLYSLGDPQLFHSNYTASIQFLDKFEHSCEVQTSVRRLRSLPSYKNFIEKWNLDLYFQIRFQEIATDFEQASIGSFKKAAESSDNAYALTATCAAWSCLGNCWNDQIFLSPLKNNFWKLSLQLLSRYKSWAFENLKETNENAFLIALLIKDVELLISQVQKFYVDIICTKLNIKSSCDVVKDAFDESVESLKEIPISAGKQIVNILTGKCTSHLKWITNIPQRFRKTNREIPSKPSPYVSQVLSPLSEFLQESESALSPDWKKFFQLEVVNGIMRECMILMKDVLTSIKKMEDSLKILKRARDKPSGQLPSSAVTDDDKIRRQLAIDVDSFEKMISKSGLQADDIKPLKELKELVTSAERVSSLTSMS